MPIKPYDVLMAAERGRSAIRRGDIAEAERWFKLAERAGGIMAKLSLLARLEEQARRRPPRF